MAIIHIIRTPATPEHLFEIGNVSCFLFGLHLMLNLKLNSNARLCKVNLKTGSEVFTVAMETNSGAPKSTPPASSGRIAFSSFPVY